MHTHLRLVMGLLSSLRARAMVAAFHSGVAVLGLLSMMRSIDGSGDVVSMRGPTQNEQRCTGAGGGLA